MLVTLGVAVTVEVVVGVRVTVTAGVWVTVGVGGSVVVGVRVGRAGRGDGRRRIGDEGEGELGSVGFGLAVEVRQGEAAAGIPLDAPPAVSRVCVMVSNTMSNRHWPS